MRGCSIYFMKSLLLAIALFVFITAFTLFTQQKIESSILRKLQLRNFSMNLKLKEPPAAVRILCWVLTNPPNLDTRTIYIKKSWGPRCDIILYFSTTGNSSFPTIGLNISDPESKSLNSLKVKRAWKYVYENYFDKAEFFMKTDDDTYVIVNNLRGFIANKSPNAAEYYGRLFIEPSQNISYMSGGAGLVLTKEALRRLYPELIRTDYNCMPHGEGEDWKICTCLEKVGVFPADTRDHLGRERFLPLSIQDHLQGRYPDWFYIYDAHGAKAGEECCSDYPITFHYVSGINLLAADYQIHRVKENNIDF